MSSLLGKSPNDINAKTTVCAIIGNPVEHSMSPAMHNPSYEALGINFCYVAFRVDPENVKDAIRGIRALGIRGVSVTVPHKVAVMEHLDEIDETAQKIGAINTIVNNNGHLKGYNTDWEGCMKAIEEKQEIKGKNVVLIGAGGAGRGIAFGISKKGGNLLICDRDTSRVDEIASATNATPFSSEQLKDNLQDADILIHATPVGMHPNEDKSIIPKEYLHPNLLVHDIVYNPWETKLVKEAKEGGCAIVLGYKMLLWQGVTQFELFTGVDKAPVEVMEEALIKHLTT